MKFSSLLSQNARFLFLIMALALDHVALASHGPPVHITHVRPSEGSLAGGTRMIVRGTGFSTNTGGGNVIQIGPYLCDPIPLHSQPAQIACKTRSALDGAWGNPTWSGHTGRLPVVVYVNGKASACESSDKWGCTFEFTSGSYHTPRIYGITPRSIKTGQLITVTGRFSGKPFNFDEMRAPSQEVPLASVKVANREIEQQNPKNEPFGQSGTRCGLFDPNAEEPYGITFTNGEGEVTQFLCEVNRGQAGGRYNLSVALLGEGMVPDELMNMGESQAGPGVHQGDHTGVGYMLQHTPTILNVSPRIAGQKGGSKITIDGDSFSNDKKAVTVSVGGSECKVSKASLDQIVCKLKTQPADFTPLLPAPGHRGIEMKLWYSRGCIGFDSFRGSNEMANAMSNTSTLTGLFEAPSDVQYARDDSSGPIGRFRAFFRAPVTASYTFMTATDDLSELWIAKAENNMTDMEKVLESTGWIGVNDFSKELGSRGEWYGGGGYSLEWRSQFHKARTSKRIEMRKGEFRWLEAWYRSCSGGDNFALAAVVHESTVNRKDTPYGVDEKQQIDLELATQFQIVNVSVSGGPGGTFKLRIGGKASRAVSIEATEHEVAAAVRELLSNCEGDVGLGADAAGNTFDCFQGYGHDYRGVVSVTKDGEVCKRWDETEMWSPWLAMAAKLDSNLCRNPDNDNGGPWCFNAAYVKVTCAVPRCGGENSSSAPLLETFEDEPTDMQGTTAFMEHFGVIPRVSRSTSFCGEASGYFPNSQALMRANWRKDPMKNDEQNWHWSHDFPFICMAYRIPQTTQMAIMIHIGYPRFNRELMQYIKDDNGDQTYDTKWTSIWMTNTHQSYAKIGDWPVTNDGEWHYSCLDLQSMLDTVGSSGEQPDFWPGSNFKVLQFRFEISNAPRSTYAAHEFWIDEFSFSKTARQIAQTEYPRLKEMRPQLVSVSRFETATGVTFQLQLTSADCKTQMEAEFDLADLDGISEGRVTSVQDHSALPDGNLVVSYGNKRTSFPPWATAEEVQDALSDIKAIGQTSVYRTGTCATGFGWQVQFTHLPGDLPLLEVSTEQITAGDFTVSVSTVEDGGVLMAPLSADYMHTPVESSEVTVIVNEVAGTCEEGVECGFNFDSTYTPILGGFQQGTQAADGSNTIVLTGSNFLPAEGSTDEVEIFVGDAVCEVTSATDTRIECDVPTGLRAGVYAITVVIPGKGEPQVSARRSGGCVGACYTVTPVISSINPATITLANPQTITITGSGFDSNLVGITVDVAGGIQCVLVEGSATTLACSVDADPATLTLGNLAVNVTVDGASVLDSSSLSLVAFTPPSVSSVGPSFGSAGGGDVLLISGSDFSASESSVTIAGKPCLILDSNSTQIRCRTGSGPVGIVKLIVKVTDAGGDSTDFEYKLSIASVVPNDIGLGGDVDLIIDGEGFVSGSGEEGTVALAVAGTQVYAIGVYAPRLIKEVHQVAVAGIYVNEVQRVRVTDGAATHFTLGSGSAVSDVLPADVDQFVMADALNAALEEPTSVRVTKGNSGGTYWDVMFFGDVGDVELLEGHACSSSDKVTCTNAGGVDIQESTAGQSPSGVFNLTDGGQTVSVSATASAQQMRTAIQALPVGDGGVEVEQSRWPDGLQWKISYSTFTGLRQLPAADDAGLSGTGVVEVARLAQGTSAPSGSWQMSLDGKWSRALDVDASDEDVRAAVEEAFGGVSAVQVVEARDAPGQFLNRRYPKQWAVRFTRQGVAGNGVDRCTDPLYVDWDPAACPSAAADLFLSFYPWYWPVGLPKPGDLGEGAQQARLRAQCDTEARALNLRPGRCEALVPLETLPICGQGSGVNPPCWVERFSTAQVQLLDGSRVNFRRDEANAPSDTTKGFRAWKRVDLEARMQAQMLAINTSVADFGSGMHVQQVATRAEELVPCATKRVNSTRIVATVPDMTAYLSSYSELLHSDWLFAPSATWGMGPPGVLAARAEPTGPVGSATCSAGPPVTSIAATPIEPMQTSGPATTIDSTYSAGTTAVSFNVSDTGMETSATTTGELAETWAAFSSTTAYSSTWMGTPMSTTVPFNATVAVSPQPEITSTPIYIVSSSKWSTTVMASTTSAVLVNDNTVTSIATSPMSSQPEADEATSTSAIASAVSTVAMSSSAQGTPSPLPAGLGWSSYHAQLTFSSAMNAPLFTVDFWFRHTASISPLMIISSMDWQTSSGYAVLTNDADQVEFWLGTGSGKKANFNKVSGGAVVLGKWTHIAASFDGEVQKLYVGGSLVTSMKLADSFQVNTNAPLTVGFECEATAQEWCPGGVDWPSMNIPEDAQAVDLLWYDVALPSGAIRGHAAGASQVLLAQVRVEVGGARSVCDDDCKVTMAASLTPMLHRLDTAEGWDGKYITIHGSNFLSANEACDVKVAIGPHSCSIWTVEDSKIVCRIQVDPNSSPVGQFQVSVSVPYVGRTLGNSTAILLTSTMTQISPSTGSLLGGTTVTITGRGLSSNVRVQVGSTPCDVVSATSTVVTCVMKMQAPGAVDNDDVVDVEVFAGAQKAGCDAPAHLGCSLRMSDAATPRLASISHATVREGTTLVIRGSNLPADMPQISAGPFSGEVTSYNSSTIICEVGLWDGGRYKLGVRYDKGFASDDTGVGCCYMVEFAVEISALSPTAGSKWGGQVLTVFGSGFSGEREKNRVLIEGKRGEVLSANETVLVIRTPPSGDGFTASVGYERDLMVFMKSCGNSGQPACLDGMLADCLNGRGFPPIANPTSRLEVHPAPEGHVLNFSLFDADPRTVWNSKNGQDVQLISMDLGVSKQITSINIAWAGMSSPHFFLMHVGDDCGALSTVANVSVPSNMWDYVSIARLGPQAQSYSAQYIVIELRGRKAGMQDFRIRDIVVVEDPIQEMSVLVGDATSNCVGGSGCNYTFESLSPEITGILPVNGGAGTLLTVSATQLDSSNCWNNVITIGAVECTTVSCSASEVVCEVGNNTAGPHGVSLTVLGVGHAAPNTLTFDHVLSLSAVSPAQGGFGGAVELQLFGDGFAMDGDRTKVRICDAECEVTQASTRMVQCWRLPIRDVPTAVNQRSFTVAVSGEDDDAMEDIETGVLSVNRGDLVFTLSDLDDWSRDRIFIRFSALDIAQGTVLKQVKLNLRAGSSLCPKNTKIRVWAEASDNSAPFRPAMRGELGSRPVTASSVDWETNANWYWTAEAIESADISAVISEVVSRPGWRAGSALTLVLRQESRAAAACSMLSMDYGEYYAPKLRVELDSTMLLEPPVPTEQACSVSVSIGAKPNHGGPGMPCNLKVPIVAATASSSDLATDNEITKEAFRVTRREWSFDDAFGFCTRQGVRLCTQDQILGDDKNVFFAVPDWDLFVPVLWYNSGGDIDWRQWLSVRSTATDFGQRSRASQRETEIIPCCGSFEHPAYMAADDDESTFWRAADDDDEAALVVDLGMGKATVKHVQIHWADGYASEYTVETSENRREWSLPLNVTMADGDVDELSFLEDMGPVQFVRIRMTSLRGSGAGFGIREVRVFGCSLKPVAVAVAELANRTAGALFTARKDKTPMVTSVTPSRGSTAGGTDVTIRGHFLTADAALLNVTFGPFACAVQSVSDLGADEAEIHCKTSAAGPSNGGEKYVVVTSRGHGSSVATANFTYWYIDAWSSRTTWGGSAPPTGCGLWVDDPACTDTVVIPAGQVVLVDQDLPRFYLILIEGKLVFERKDISMSANYILIRGGTLEIGTELEPFEQNVHITLVGHPKSVDLPTFGAKVIACYECTLDIHGKPQVAWTELSATTYGGATEITVQDPVAWPVGSKIVIATTDFESPLSSHSEVATVTGVFNGGHRVTIGDVGVCSSYTDSGIPTNCSRRASLTWPHLGETRTVDGRTLEFRAEVGLLSRNIVIEGDYDERLCPLADMADDGVTRLSCNQFGGQIFLHSPGHESLVARLSNFEIRNAGQAFRLGRYAIHWHMIGNLRESFQFNVSVHHSWNRGAAIHGVNYLRVAHNVFYNVMGHTLFIEDGIEEYNRVEGNLGIKTLPSMNLLNTDQTPAVFWIVTGKNYILRNHAVASRRYGLWFRPEISVTGTSANTDVEVHPINIPILEFDGNVGHSNGKYGLRIFDVFLPNSASVFKNTFVWRNGKVGWTATVIGRVAFDNMVSVQNGVHVFESRSVSVDNWHESYISNSLFVDAVVPALPLGQSFAAFSDSFGSSIEVGGPSEGGILLPWNTDAGGGMSVINTTFVNFHGACIRGCAHCGRGGSPVVGDGGYETRFAGMKFVNSPERALFRHPNEANLYDLDGTLTDTGIKENYTRGGDVRGASLVGRSVLLPPGNCSNTNLSTTGTGGSICTGIIFRRMWHHIRKPSAWVGKALCVRTPGQATMNTCQNLQPECNCLPYLKKGEKGNVWLAAEGHRYISQMDLLPHELADPEEWDIKVSDVEPEQKFYFSQRFLQWASSDKFNRPLYWSRIADGRVGPRRPANWIYNASAVPFPQIFPDPSYPHTDADLLAEYINGTGSPGQLPIPAPDAASKTWALKQDADGNGGVHTFVVRGPDRGQDAQHSNVNVQIKPCPDEGCPPPPPPPPRPPAEKFFSLWSEPATWYNTTSHAANPLVTIDVTEFGNNDVSIDKLEVVEWAGNIPGAFEDVWIPYWKKVLLDVTPPMLGRLVVEGTLVINASSRVDLSATWIELKGGSLIIAETDAEGQVVGPFTGHTEITLAGTNARLAAAHGVNPREVPELSLGREGVQVGSGVLGVMGVFVAKGMPVNKTWVSLAQSAEEGDTWIVVEGMLDWRSGSEIVLTPSDFDMHESDTAVVAGITWLSYYLSNVTLASPLKHRHFAGAEEAYGTRRMQMQSKVGLLSHNIVIKGAAQGEDKDYTEWNSPRAGDAGAFVCDNGVCENGETSLTCPGDCYGPAWEYGAGILVAGYTEDYTDCSQAEECTTGYRRSFEGRVDMEYVELRYFAQNNLRPGLAFKNVQTLNSTVKGVAFNRGYFEAVTIADSSHITIDSCVFYRSHLPALEVTGGASSVGNVITGNLGVVGIFWNTHRGAIQGKGLASADLRAMIGMFHDEGSETRLWNNVASGSERAGFSGSGVECGNTTLFKGNEAFSCLAGYWFDPYRLASLVGQQCTTTTPGNSNGNSNGNGNGNSNGNARGRLVCTEGRQCTALPDFQAWKIYEYTVHGEVPHMPELRVTGLRSADSRVGVYIIMKGASSKSHTIADQRVRITDSLFVGHSTGNGNCENKRPGLHTCTFYMAYCNHVGPAHRGIYVSQFLSGGNMAPLIKPWFDAGAYPSLYGQTDVEGVTFAEFGQPCNSGPRAGQWDAAVSGLPNGAGAADAWGVVTLKQIQMVNVAMEAKVHLYGPSAGWINQADCIDMDCDGPKHALLRDEDGTFLEEASGGTILPRAEDFSANSFFGVPYKDPVNLIAAKGQDWWYPNLPTVMRGDRGGGLVNVSDTWLKRGFGITRAGCTLVPEWNAWRCATTTSYRRLVIESMDRDHEIRRISPVALSSQDGYTDLLNGCMDHGWCFSYTCLKRLMTFWAVVAMGQEYTVHFTGTNPQKLRLHLPYAPADEQLIVKIYYQSSQRLQVFVGDRFVEDVNTRDGRPKAQLFRDGRWASNNGGSGYTDQLVSLECSCLIGASDCRAVGSPSVDCERRSDVHGASRWNRKDGFLEIVVGGHGRENYIDIKTMPVMAVSVGLSVSVEDFYKVKDAFVSNIAAVLGIDLKRISIVDVVPGNARRRQLRRAIQLPGVSLHSRSLLAGDSVLVDFEVISVPELAVQDTFLLESVGSGKIQILRTINTFESVSVDYMISVGSEASDAQAGVHFTNVNGTITFNQHQESAEITIPIINVAGHNPNGLSFQVMLSNPQNATIIKATALVSILEVQAPAPSAPFQDTATTGSSFINVVWDPLDWNSAPETSLAIVQAYAVQKMRTDNGTSAWENVDGTATLRGDGSWEVRVAELPTFSTWVFQVAAQTSEGWTAWSASSVAITTKSVCGDGNRQGVEGCDVGAAGNTTGCQRCTSVVGFSCEGKTPDVCAGGCGDGTQRNREECDDSNNMNGDGCSSQCRFERGWTCAAVAGALTADCTTTCGDGIKAGPEECDSGSLNGQNHGCDNSCNLETGAICVEGAGGLSTCQICGNGLLEGTEVCDDNDATQGCNSNCLGVRTGWSCKGGDIDTPDVCSPGPAKPRAPIGGGITASLITFKWVTPSGYGETVLNYTLTWFIVNSGFTNMSVVDGNSLTLANLAPNTQYRARVRACSAVGCSPYSDNSVVSITSAVSAFAEFAGLASGLAADPTRLVDGLNASITQMELETPEAPAEAPPEDDGLLNETEYAAYLASLNGSNPELEGTPQPAAAPVVNNYFGQPAVGFKFTSVSTDNGNGSFAISLSFSNPDANGGAFVSTLAAGGVRFEVRELSARRGVDFNLPNGTVVFAGGASMAMLQLPILEGSRSVRYPIMLQVVLTGTLDATQLQPSVGLVVNVTINNPAQRTELVIDVTTVTPVTLSNGQGVVIPAGALFNNTAISVERDVAPPAVPTSAPGAIQLISDVLTFGPSGLQFLQPVSIYLVLNSISSERMAIHWYNATLGAWAEVPGTMVNTTTGLIWVETTHFSSYGAFSVPCSNDTYLNSSSTGYCSACPSGASSDAGSTSLMNCTCQTGHTGSIWSGCTMCVNGTFISEANDTVAQCKCFSGFYGSDGTCTACVADTYCPGNGSKYACPNSTRSYALSSSIANCSCEDGYTGDYSVGCTPVTTTAAAITFGATTVASTTASLGGSGSSATNTSNSAATAAATTTIVGATTQAASATTTSVLQAEATPAASTTSASVAAATTASATTSVSKTSAGTTATATTTMPDSTARPDTTSAADTTSAPATTTMAATAAAVVDTTPASSMAQTVTTLAADTTSASQAAATTSLAATTAVADTTPASSMAHAVTTLAAGTTSASQTNLAADTTSLLLAADSSVASTMAETTAAATQAVVTSMAALTSLAATTSASVSTASATTNALAVTSADATTPSPSTASATTNELAVTSADATTPSSSTTMSDAAATTLAPTAAATTGDAATTTVPATTTGSAVQSQTSSTLASTTTALNVVGTVGIAFDATGVSAATLVGSVQTNLRAAFASEFGLTIAQIAISSTRRRRTLLQDDTASVDVTLSASSASELTSATSTANALTDSSLTTLVSDSDVALASVAVSNIAITVDSNAVATTSSSTTSTVLNCLAGQSGESGSCMQCEPGFWCPGGASGTACPLNAMSPANSSVQTDCACVAGYYGETGQTCVICSPGAWCPGGAQRTACPGSTTSGEGSAQVAQCRCSGGLSVLLNYDCAALVSPRLSVSGKQNSKGAYVGFVRVAMVPSSQTNLSFSLGSDASPVCSASDGQGSEEVALYESTVIKAVSCGLYMSSDVIAQEIVIKEGGKVKIFFTVSGNVGNTPEVRRGLRRRFSSLFGLADDQVLVKLSDIRRRLLQASVEVELLAEDETQFKALQTRANTVTADDVTAIVQGATGDSRLTALGIEVEASRGALSELSDTTPAPIPDVEDDDGVAVGAAIGGGVVGGLLLLCGVLFCAYKMNREREQRDLQLNDAKTRETGVVFSNVVYADEIKQRDIIRTPPPSPPLVMSTIPPQAALGAQPAVWAAGEHLPPAPVFPTLPENFNNLPTTVYPGYSTPQVQTLITTRRVSTELLPEAFPEPLYPIQTLPQPTEFLPPAPTPLLPPAPTLPQALGPFADQPIFPQLEDLGPFSNQAVFELPPVIPDLMGLQADGDYEGTEASVMSFHTTVEPQLLPILPQHQVAHGYRGWPDTGTMQNAPAPEYTQMFSGQDGRVVMQANPDLPQHLNEDSAA